MAIDWRASTDAADQADLDRLLADSLQVASTSLAHQNLTPFMLVVDRAGERTLRVLADPAGSSFDDVVGALQRDDDVETLRARAITTDVTVREPFVGDAINVHLEHRAGMSIDVLVPYRSTPDGIVIDAEDRTASSDAARLWAHG